MTTLDEKARELAQALKSPAVIERLKLFTAGNPAITPERLATAFGSFLHAAAQDNPNLLTCTTSSIVTCLLDIAALGWAPTTIPELQKFAIVDVWNGKTQTRKAKLVLTRAGQLDLIKRIPGVQSVQVELVRENDQIEITNGTTVEIKHKIAPTNRGQTIGAYAIARFKNGHSIVYYADREEALNHIAKLEKMDAAFKGGDPTRQGRYTHAIENARAHFDEFIRRYVVRRLLRYIANEVPGSQLVDGFDAKAEVLAGPRHEENKLLAASISPFQFEPTQHQEPEPVVTEPVSAPLEPEPAEDISLEDLTAETETTDVYDVADDSEQAIDTMEDPDEELF